MWNASSFALYKTPSHRSRKLTYCVAIVAMLIAFLMVRWMERYFTPTPATLFLCAILFSTLWGGLGPCLLTVAGSILIFDFFYIAPYHAFSVEMKEVPRLLIFSITAIFVGGLGTAQNASIKSLREAYAKLADAIKALKLTNLALEHDNAERRKIHDQLRYSEAFLNEGQKISQTGSWRWNIATAELIWSDEHYRIFGYETTHGPATAAMFSERVHPDDAASVRHIVYQTVAQRDRFECEYRIVLPGGETRYLHAVGCPISPMLPGADEYIGTTVDITARQLTEESLHKSEEAFRTLSENLPDGLIRYDRDCRRIYANPAFYKATGLTPERALNTPLEDDWGAETPVAEYVDFLRGIMASGIPGQTVGAWNGRNGENTYYSSHVVAERDRNGDVVSVLAIGRDITFLKKAEQKLEESQRLLRQLADRSETEQEEERKHLARELHDDLAQHLSALRMKISLLKIEYGQQLPSLEREIQNMLSLVDSTIRMTRNAITTLRPAALDMGIVSALEWLQSEFVGQTGIRCTLDIGITDDSLGDRSATAIFRIVQESLRNIGKHAAASDVAIRFERRGDTYVLRVCDNGVGFDPALKKEKTFGLLGMQERALMLGGKVTTATAPGRGTEIEVGIPICSTMRDR
jgi:PAS domain S-box-containing protein